MFFDVLTQDELERRDRLRTLKLRLSYQHCRSALRVILGLYSGQNPAELRFCYGKFGKPKLPDRGLHFNVSQSGNLGLVAIALHSVGVDLELINPLVVDADLVNVFCHPFEKALFEPLPLNKRSSLFYQLLTRKEAYCKALGIGLQRAFRSLRFDDLDSLRSQVYDEDVADTVPFFAYDLRCIIGYSASVCLPYSDARISLFKLEPRKN